MKEDSQINAIVDGIVDYLKSVKSLDLLPDVAQKLLEESWVKVDNSLAQVFSRVKLTAGQIKSIKIYLSRHFGQAVRVKTKIDPSIIAGFRINIAGRTIDATVNRNLEELRKKVIYD